MSEAERQNALLRVLRSLGPDGRQLPTLGALLAQEPALRLRADCVAGLAPHGAHARAVSQRALTHAYPTLTAMLGPQAMGHLAGRLWQQCPPRRGDLGTWGGELADWLDGGLTKQEGVSPAVAPPPELATWPWLADTARLDWARHLAERTAAQAVDTASLQTLAHAAPHAITLVWQPHVHVLHSMWPLHALWQAHQGPAEGHAAALAQALRLHRDAGAPPHTVVVSWQAHAGVGQWPLPPAQSRWMRALCAPGTSLGAALDAVPHEPADGFDFQAWWLTALQRGWLQGARPLAAGQ